MSPSPGRPRSARRRAARAAVVALATLLAAAGAPAGAHASTAPTRFIGIGTNGQRSDQLRPIAVSNDGTEILGVFGSFDVIRDVSAGVTHDILQQFDELQGASADLKRIIFTTRRQLVPGDTNTLTDLYMWDRPSDTYALVSKDRSGASLITSDTQHIEQIAISNLGTGIQFAVRDGDLSVIPGEDTSPVAFYRYEASRSFTQPIADVIGASFRPQSIGDNGTTLLVGDQVIAPTHTTTLPGRLQSSIVTSPSGQYVAWQAYDGGTATGIDSTNGNTATITYPSSIKAFAQLYGIADDASTITLGGYVESFKRFAFAHLSRNGSLRQLGGDIPLTESPVPSSVVLSQNEQFALSGLVLAQLGSKPLPGTEPTAPSNAAAFDYVYVNDFVCPSGYTGTPKRPQLSLTRYAQRSDLRLPVKATAKVWKDGSATISNDMTVYPGQSKDLYVGLKGGYRVDTAVTLTGGTVLTATKHYDAHDQWTCFGL